MMHGENVFQSTLPTRGSDGIAGFLALFNTTFQSTLPTRGSDTAFCSG